MSPGEVRHEAWRAERWFFPPPTPVWARTIASCHVVAVVAVVIPRRSTSWAASTTGIGMILHDDDVEAAW